MNEKFWKNKKVCITGAALIGSHLAEELLKLGAKVRVVNKTHKHFHYLPKGIEFNARDLRKTEEAEKAVKGQEIVFHLAADHGGRGYVDTHNGEIASNLLLDGSVFRACLKQKAKVVYASSGCVYPNYLQMDTKKAFYLKERMVGPPYEADNMYGWAKLMGEMTLKHYHEAFRLPTVSLRYFTVYGERGVENHAVIAMIAKAFIKQDPFEIWGTGEQLRNWTYVKDIVRGTILAAEKIGNGTAINLGTMERISVIDAAWAITTYAEYKPKMKLLPKMPTGPYNRVADNKLAYQLLGWKPEVKFVDGVLRTLNWYFKVNRSKDKVREIIKNQLLEK